MPITSLPFVHTARRCFRWMAKYRLLDWLYRREDNRYLIIRGSKSRNKVAVGEPAAGSFFRCPKIPKTNRGWRFISPLLTNQIKFTFCRSTPVEHGSHNVSRWMTWLSISLKNAAACDKWYQLQNHFITESLNANGAWEKPFVGHPRACHTQCRTNKKSPPKRIYFRPTVHGF